MKTRPTVIIFKAAMHYHILYKHRLQLYNCVVQLVYIPDILWWPGWDTSVVLTYMTSDSFTHSNNSNLFNLNRLLGKNCRANIIPNISVGILTNRPYFEGTVPIFGALSRFFFA